MSLCVGAHGWVAGIASNGSVLLSRGWLITVEGPGHPRHPPSTQLDAVVNENYLRSAMSPDKIVQGEKYRQKTKEATSRGESQKTLIYQ